MIPHDVFNSPEMTWQHKLGQISWSFIGLITIVSMIGFATLYSAAQGSWSPWAIKQIIRFGVGMVFLLMIAMIDLRTLMRFSYLIYAICLLLLVAVELFGFIGMGAQRWIDLGFIQLQPSELMKLALILALARYFHCTSYEDTGRLRHLGVPALLVLLPVVLVLRQPNLGTATILSVIGGVLFLVSGVRFWKIAIVVSLLLVSLPVTWHFMHDYQKQRVRTFLNPEKDPLGAGYHITQSKIAFGSGGIFGKGFMQGTQSRLNFLPEKETDFIFTMWAEEFGLVGAYGVLGLYVMILFYCYGIAARSRSHFGQFVALGVATSTFLYIAINIAMVTGLIPVVGIPLPLMSYGGTVMLTVLMSFGLVMNVWVHRDVRMRRRSGET